MPIKLGFKDVIFVMEDVDAASKVVQRRDGKTGVVARLEDRRFPSASPEEAALLVGGKEATPWRLLQGSDDSEVQELVAELMEKSERLKAAAIAPDNLRAAVAGLRLPRPAAPSTDKERAELESTSTYYSLLLTTYHLLLLTTYYYLPLTTTDYVLLTT